MKKIVVSVLLCTIVVSMVQADDSEVTMCKNESKIILDVITKSATELLKITFEDNVTANMGNEITPFQTRNQPHLDWNADENSFYTIMNLDPDAPGTDYPFNALLNTWMVGNIPGKDVESGEVLYEYIPAATARGWGFNRYGILVFRQQGKLDFKERHIDRYHFEGRQRFALGEFVSKYGLGSPVAANYYVTQYDHYVLFVYRQLQCCFELNRF